MLGLSSGLMYGATLDDDGLLASYDSMFDIDSTDGWNFGANGTTITENPTGGVAANSNYCLIAWLANGVATSWTRVLHTTSDLDGGIVDGDKLTITYDITLGNSASHWSSGSSNITIITALNGFSFSNSLYTFSSIPMTTNNHNSPTTVAIEVTKSGGTQNHAVSIDIGTFSGQLFGASATLRSFQSRVYR